MNILEKIRDAEPGSMVTISSPCGKNGCRAAEDSFPVEDLRKVMSAQMFDLTNPPERGIIFLDRRVADIEAFAKALQDAGVPEGVKWVIPVDDVSHSLAILVSEADLASLGYRCFNSCEANK